MSPTTQPPNFTLWKTLKTTFSEWSEDNASRLAAAFAYYAIFSIGPLLIIAIAVVSLFFGPRAENDQIRPQIAQFVGNHAADFIQDLIKHAAISPSFSFAGIISILLLLYAATNLFAALQSSLNTIFDVQLKPGRGISAIIKDRAITFLMVLVIGVVVLASVVLNTLLAGIASWSNSTFLQHHHLLGQTLVQGGSFVISAAIFTLIFALLFKYLPDVKIDWKDTWIGAFATAILFTAARVALAFYLNRSSTAGPFGAAGSLVIVMLFIYYSSQILFLGAEFTQIWACREGHPITPSKNALSLKRKHKKRLIAAIHENNNPAANRHAFWWPPANNSRKAFPKPKLKKNANGSYDLCPTANPP